MTNKQTKSGSYYEKVQNPSQVDAYIGTSYDVVKEVYNNLEAIRKVESAIDDISVIAKDVTNGDYISDMERIDDQFLVVDQQLVDANTRIDSNATDISNLSTLTTQITNNINVLDNEVSLIDSKVEQSKQDISTVQSDISSISTDIDLLNTRLTNEENKTVVDTTARASAANAQSKADSNEAEIVTLKSDIENISIETNLSTTATATEVTINSDTGTDATINPASSSNAGLMTPEQYSKLDGLSNYDDSALSTRVTENESDITNLQDQANSNNSSINQITNNISMLDSRVTNLENAGGTGGGTSYIERQFYDPSNSVGSGVILKNDPNASRVDITFKDITESVHIESDLLFDCKDLDVFNFIGDTGSVVNIGMDFNNLMNVGVELPYSIIEGDIMTVTILDVSKGIIKAEVKSVYEYDEDIPSSQIRAMITALEDKDVLIESDVNAIDTRLTTAELNISNNDTNIVNLSERVDSVSLPIGTAILTSKNTELAGYIDLDQDFVGNVADYPKLWEKYATEANSYIIENTNVFSDAVVEVGDGLFCYAANNLFYFSKDFTFASDVASIQAPTITFTDRMYFIGCNEQKYLYFADNYNNLVLVRYKHDAADVTELQNSLEIEELTYTGGGSVNYGYCAVTKSFLVIGSTHYHPIDPSTGLPDFSDDRLISAIQSYSDSFNEKEFLYDDWFFERGYIRDMHGTGQSVLLGYYDCNYYRFAFHNFKENATYLTYQYPSNNSLLLRITGSQANVNVEQIDTMTSAASLGIHAFYAIEGKNSPNAYTFVNHYVVAGNIVNSLGSNVHDKTNLIADRGKGAENQYYGPDIVTNWSENYDSATGYDLGSKNDFRGPRLNKFQHSNTGFIVRDNTNNKSALVSIYRGFQDTFTIKAVTTDSADKIWRVRGE